MVITPWVTPELLRSLPRPLPFERVQRSLDLGGEEIEVGVSGVVVVEGVEAEVFPPGSCPGMQSGDDDRATGRLGVELGGGRDDPRYGRVAAGPAAPGGGGQSIQRKRRGRPSAAARRSFTRAGSASASLNAPRGLWREVDNAALGEHFLGMLGCGLEHEG